MKLTIIIIIFWSFYSNAQNSKSNELANTIPYTEFSSVNKLGKYIRKIASNDEEFVRITYVWIANNISYDIKNLYSEDTTTSMITLSEKTLKTKKAKCHGYSALFSELCRQNGIKSFIIPGIVKQNNKIAKLSHSWVCVYLNEKWRLYDPTWAAGYILDEKKFVKSFNNDYYEIKPEINIKTHLPFDPIWQMLEYPIKAHDFENNLFNNSNSSKYNYSDSISVYESQNEFERLENTFRRTSQNGNINFLTNEYLKILNNNINIINKNILISKKNKASQKYNLAIDNYNKCIKLYNSYINFKNKQFKQFKNSDDIYRIIDSCNYYINECKRNILMIDEEENKLISNTSTLKNNSDKITINLAEEKKYIDNYYKNKTK